MIDAERMLGSLVRNAMSGGRSRGRSRRKRSRGGGLGRSLLGGAGKGALAMGALGVAVAAFEHFSNQQKSGNRFTGGKPSAPPPPGSGVGALPPPPLPSPPSADATTASIAPPPPPPGAAPGPETAAPTRSASDTNSNEALLLVRAMIAAANADHEVDDEERDRILKALDGAGLGDEERRFILSEIEAPIGIGALASEAASPELARQVYLASLMAIEVDTVAEQNYLARLAKALELGEAEVDELEAMLQT